MVRKKCNKGFVWHIVGALNILASFFFHLLVGWLCYLERVNPVTIYRKIMTPSTCTVG